MVYSPTEGKRNIESIASGYERNVSASYIPKSNVAQEDYKLGDAVRDFRMSYIPAVAEYTGISDIRGLSRKLNHDRSELSNLVNDLEVKDLIKADKGREYWLSPEDFVSKNESRIFSYSGSEVVDSIAKRVFLEAAEKGDYSLKAQTDRFKEFYTVTAARASENLEETADSLGVNPKTLKKWLERYYENPDNVFYFSVPKSKDEEENLSKDSDSEQEEHTGKASDVSGQKAA